MIQYIVLFLFSKFFLLEKTLCAAAIDNSEMKKILVARNYEKEQKLKIYQESCSLSELARLKDSFNCKSDLVTATFLLAICSMKFRIEENKQEVHSKMIPEALLVLGLHVSLKPSWADIQKAYEQLNKDSSLYPSPALLDQAFLILREFKDTFPLSNEKIGSLPASAGYMVFEIYE